MGAATPPLFRASRVQCEAPMLLHVRYVLHVLPLVLHVLQGGWRGCAAVVASLLWRRGAWGRLRCLFFALRAVSVRRPNLYFRTMLLGLPSTAGWVGGTTS